jgi:hypothetical protein
MRLKTELYEKEQHQIIDTIIDILDLQNKDSYTLYELDNNQDIQKRILQGCKDSDDPIKNIKSIENYRDTIWNSLSSESGKF